MLQIDLGVLIDKSLQIEQEEVTDRVLQIDQEQEGQIEQDQGE